VNNPAVEQKSAAMNFQHGETYLSPSASTAIRYAANNRYGSELLTYTMEFLRELVRLKANGVCDKLYRKFPHAFEKLDISPAPLLIQVDDVEPTALVAENGASAKPVLEYIQHLMLDSPHLCPALLQQSNFRLVQPVPLARLKVWLVNVTRPDSAFPEYSLHLLCVQDDVAPTPANGPDA
jgi:hypothetical protein